MSITNRDNILIKNWFEPYKFADISMLERVFFKNQHYGYSICRKRLLELMKEDYIKCFKDESTNRNIYVYNEKGSNPPSTHRLILLSLLAELIYLGFNIERFEIEKSWCNRKYFSDVLLQFTTDHLGDEKGKRYYFFVEVMISNNHHRLEKYNDIFETGEVQRYLIKDKEYFPKVLLISDRRFHNIHLKHTKVYQLDTKLNKLSSILL